MDHRLRHRCAWLPLIVAASLVALPVGSAFGADDDDPVVQVLLGAGIAGGTLRAGNVRDPAAIAPRAPAKPAAYFIHWDKYRTLVVVDSSAGLLRPAWVVTFATAPETIKTLKGDVTVNKDQVEVCYRAQAYHDKDGVLHIDASKSVICGIFAGGAEWSPDSFDIGADLMVTTHDDDPGHPGNDGEVEKTVLPAQQSAEYRRLLLIAQAIVEGNS